MHYYTNNVDEASKESQFTTELRGCPLKLTTDIGVFSKSDVDFGSRLLVEAFQAPEVEGKFLDVGCGYGPIGLTLAKCHPQRRVEMVDVNLRAIGLSQKNAKLNGVSNVRIFESSVYEQVAGKFAAILSNPPIRAGKKVVHEILSGSKAHLLPGGELWIVIQKKQGAPSAQQKMEEVFGNCDVVVRKKGYFILRSKNLDTIAKK